MSEIIGVEVHAKLIAMKKAGCFRPKHKYRRYPDQGVVLLISGLLMTRVDPNNKFNKLSKINELSIQSLRRIRPMLPVLDLGK